ncbi:hypotheical conserved protein [Brevundimonas abyssalis TAR-001]|uniref:Hypotheical conserved protein n=1 Tax=Brevundimonas abyssalis TAR-001 TaxID=1391729 RepID=A0A8E0KIK1_9CAUL|nr:hypotheical conserved protein [Brevundimonas abyssalis TAR-001]
MLCRCPNCGKGPLFEGFLKIRPVCETCGYDLASVATGDGAASFIMQIAGAWSGFPPSMLKSSSARPCGCI